MKDRDVTRERFLSAIAAQVNADAIAEAHLFQPIKQGGMESGVAVVAVSENPLSTAGAAAENSLEAETLPAALGAAEDGIEAGNGLEAESREASARAIAPLRELNAPAALGAAAENGRLAVYTARYRLTLKGPERGKWDFAMHAEADAPLVTVDRVVRGVQRRSGDVEEPRRLTGDEFRAQVQKDRELGMGIRE